MVYSGHQAPFAERTGVFAPITELDPPLLGRAVFVNPIVEATPFGLAASFRVRNDSRNEGTWIPVVRTRGSQFTVDKMRTGFRIRLSPGQTSEAQRLQKLAG